MGKPFQLSLIADFRDAIRGSKDVSTSLDQVASSMDDLARDTAEDAEKASEALKSEFSEAVDTVKRETKSAGDAVGTNIKHGTKEAEEGTKSLKENAQQNAKEVAASFDGSAQSIADGFQGLAAEAFEGFGPAGVAAGVAAAIGMGMVSKSLQDADEKAQQVKDTVADLRDQLKEAGNDVNGLDLSTNFQQWGEETQSGVKNIDRMRQASKDLGVDEHTMFLAWSGDAAARNTVQTAYMALQKQMLEQQTNVAASTGDVDYALQGQINSLNDNMTLLGSWTKMVGDAAGGNQVYADFIGTTTDKLNANTAATNTNATATTALTDKQQAAADAASGYAESLKENLTVADEGLSSLTKKGKATLEDWTKELNERAKENRTIKVFTNKIENTVSPEAFQNYEGLSTEDKLKLAEWYKKHPQQVATNLEAEVGNVTWKDGKPKVKVPKADASVTVDTKLSAPSKADVAAATAEAQKQADGHVHMGVDIPVSDAKSAANVAVNAAQDEADKSSNKIELNTKIDVDELQRQINRAAASITPPTITVKTKVQKQVP